MRRLVSTLAAVSALAVASPAFAALDAYRSAKGEVVQAEVKNGKLVDAKGTPLADGEWTWVSGGSKVTVSKGSVIPQLKPGETIPPIKPGETKAK